MASFSITEGAQSARYCRSASTFTQAQGSRCASCLADSGRSMVVLVASVALAWQRELAGLECFWMNMSDKNVPADSARSPSGWSSKRSGLRPAAAQSTEQRRSGRARHRRRCSERRCEDFALGPSSAGDHGCGGGHSSQGSGARQRGLSRCERSSVRYR